MRMRGVSHTLTSCPFFRDHLNLCPSMFTPLLATISGLSPGAPGASVAAASVTSDHAGVVARLDQPAAWSSHLSRDGEPNT